MSRYFYVDANKKDTLLAELKESDCVLASDVDIISEKLIYVYCNVIGDFEHLAIDVHKKNHTQKLIRVEFGTDLY